MNLYTDIVIILRALHWYEDQLANRLVDVRDQEEYVQLRNIRARLNTMLKEKAYVD